MPVAGGLRAAGATACLGQQAPPGGDALADEHAEAERERARACVQSSIAQLFVLGIQASGQPAAGSIDLAGIRMFIQFSSRGAR